MHLFPLASGADQRVSSQYTHRLIEKASNAKRLILHWSANLAALFYTNQTKAPRA